APVNPSSKLSSDVLGDPCLDALGDAGFAVEGGAVRLARQGDDLDVDAHLAERLLEQLALRRRHELVLRVDGEHGGVLAAGVPGDLHAGPYARALALGVAAAGQPDGGLAQPYLVEVERGGPVGVGLERRDDRGEADDALQSLQAVAEGADGGGDVAAGGEADDDVVVGVEGPAGGVAAGGGDG